MFKNNNDYQIEVTQEFRTRKALSILPFLVIRGFKVDYHWTGKWFTYVEVTEQKIKERYSKLNEYSYTIFWSFWEEDWIFIKINNR